MAASRWKAGTCLLGLVLLVLAAAPARADSEYRFGYDYDVRHLQDVRYRKNDKEQLYLGYLTRTLNVFAGVALTDMGYVLGVKGTEGRFYNLPDGPELANLQRDGLLPNPLTPYRLDIWDYLRGYSLLVAIGFIVLLLLVTVAWSKLTGREGKEDTGPTPEGRAPG